MRVTYLLTTLYIPNTGGAASGSTNIFILSRLDNKRQKQLEKSRVDMQLHVNLKGGVVPNVHFKIDNPSQIQVPEVGYAS